MSKIIVATIILGSIVLAPHLIMDAAGHSMDEMGAACRTACLAPGAGASITGDYIQLFAAVVFLGVVLIALAASGPIAEKLPTLDLWLCKRRHRYFLKSFIMLQ